ncbi:MAG: site-specific integrase [Clostridia bacterium]|nr:site-specific integrase [Clostridia bacterium]
MIKEEVKLRTKKLANGNESIYLDIYSEGKRKYEYLKLYLLPGKENKLKNKETMALANAVKAQRIVDIRNGRFGFEGKKKTDITLIEWICEVMEMKLEKGKTKEYVSSFHSLILQLEGYTKGKKIKLVDVDKKFLLGFLGHMKKGSNRTKPIAEHTAYLYYTHLAITLNIAVKMGMIDRSPCKELMADEKPQPRAKVREYLTLSEIKAMIDAPCSDERVRRMFLFSCFTGLRSVDIFNLTWNNIVKVEDGVYQVEVVQQKTKQLVVVPITENALMWLPERRKRKDHENVFDSPCKVCAYKVLKQWAETAGIKKNVTFHVGRHTYATLLLYYGADLYTVSKLLGHTDIKTTQIYAKVMDETKRKAVNLIPEL